MLKNIPSILSPELLKVLCEMGQDVYKRQWGNYVRVDDAAGNRYYFCHMDSRAVSVGQRVQVGTKLGVMGNTGLSYGAHCHFETRTKSGTRTNPAAFLQIPNKAACLLYTSRCV